MDKKQTLKHYFGYESFRALQEEAIDTIVQQQDMLMILPTGGGKSLCYQLPTLMMDGITVVISPLLSLMYDQVTSLVANGINAAMVSSMQSFEEIKMIEQQVIRGEIKMLYVAPERLDSPYFISLLHRTKINFFVIDEAHCLSQWGHEFRASYRKLSILKEQFPSTPIAAFTATATQIVREDIVSELKLNKPKVIVGSVFRENLILTIKHRISDGRVQLLEFLKLHKGKSGIIYTLSRKSTESVAAYLAQQGYKVRAYHAGLSTDERGEIHNEFIQDALDMVVATIAFGMGIDKPNIRFVVHLNLPRNLESYYQEIGRAGRDGNLSQTLLLFTTADLVKQRLFIDDLEEGEYKQNAYEKLQSISQFATSSSCRHQSISHYFKETLNPCGERCDNCLQKQRESVDITTPAQKILSAIYRTKQSFGANYIVDVLKGSKSKKILQNAHDKLSVYDIGKEHSKSGWLTIIDRLLEFGAVAINDKRAYRLTDTGKKILQGKQNIAIDEERLKVSFELQVVDKHQTLQGSQQQIFERLSTVRNKIALENDIPPYIVFSQKTLAQMAVELPVTKEAMLEIHGVGEVKFERYGEVFIQEICKIKSE
ncbi:MAG: DNA helicase RecQ [Campylobacterales bacterium]|nr:DNA helicase RecQ [Campylobacterales bacterium]